MANSVSQSHTKGSRLVGWLVSYAIEDKGKSFEIRAGRSLLSSAQCPNSRVIIVTEESVSSPHAALSASVKHRVMIQDIFSESGTYLTRSDADKELTISGPTEVGHGDWLRIGENSRFQVCLIDGPNR